MLSLRKILRRFQSKESQQPTSPIFEGSQLEVFSGDYATWEDAATQCTGYDSNFIFEKTKAAALTVKLGQAVFERDSVLFYEEAHAWQMLACLLSVGASAGGRLSVLDFGGSLGSSYFQHRKILQMLPNFNWTVVEQLHYMEFGSKNLEDGFLKFFPSIEIANDLSKPNVVLLGSVLSYLPNPFEILKKIIYSGVNSIVIDRTAFLVGDRDRITIQKVCPTIYDASYPARFFSISNFKQFMLAAGFELIAEWLSFDDYKLLGEETSSRGFFFKK
jgi:putative methyltransferase (TIGR04325 family)